MLKMTQWKKEELIKQFDADFERIKEDEQIIRVDMYKADAWCLMRQVQIASQMPGNGGVKLEVAVEIVRRIQNALATTKALREVAERGWKAY